MGAGKVASKGGGFFHLFDWKRKSSRKKLFSSGNSSSEGSKPAKQVDGHAPNPHLHLIDENEMVGLSSVEGRVTDEDRNGVEAPGVIARLMGLDSLPPSAASETYSKPLRKPHSLVEKHSQKRSSEFNIDDHFDDAVKRAEICSWRVPELRPEQMPSSRIQRFQTEIFPTRSAKPVRTTHDKLFSPMTGPGSISAKNAAHIMGAAVKILEPGLQTDTNGGIWPHGSCSNPPKACESWEITAAPQRAPRLPQSSRRHVELAAMRSLRGQQSLSRSWNSSEDTCVSRTSSEMDEGHSAGPKGKGISMPLVIQAKVDVKRGEGLSVNSRNMSECGLDKPLRRQSHNHKNNQQRRAPGENIPGVLRQNNRKQNCSVSKGKSMLKSSVSNQKERKIPSKDAPSVKNNTVNRLSGNTKVGYKKEGIRNSVLEKERLSSSNQNPPQVKRLTSQGSANRHERRVQHNVVIDGHSKWTEDYRGNGTDIVSFTFTSPITKLMSASQFSTQPVEERDKNNGCFSDVHCEKNGTDSDNGGTPSLTSNVIGDFLGILLEQKLRELRSGANSPYCRLVKGGSVVASGPTLRVSSYPQCERETPQNSYDNEIGGSSTSDQVSGMNHKLQEEERAENSISGVGQNEHNHQNQRPFGIFEENWEKTNRNKVHAAASFVQVQERVDSNCTNSILPVEAEVEFCFPLTKTTDGAHALDTDRTGNASACNWELKYVREILRNTRLFENLCSCCHNSEILDPLLFDKLENSSALAVFEGVGKACRMRRKMLFDCVNECLHVQVRHYFQAGYKMWAKGLQILGKELAEVFYKEISGWKSMEDWMGDEIVDKVLSRMVDELVDKDMSSHIGRWVGFETEAFEAGVEIERGILSSLLDELVDDF